MKHPFNLLTLLSILLLAASCSSSGVRVLHYNIKELDSQKIASPNEQLENVKKVLDEYSIDILSLNEVQFDYKNVPNSLYQTHGLNLHKLRNIFELRGYNSTFYPANTGKNAKTKKDLSYFTNTSSSEARQSADKVNFGVFPGQYSTGALYDYQTVSEMVINQLKWKEFNPNIDLSKFKTADGKALPEDMELFDKNFTDVVINIKGEEVHLILLHTVPSYHFGNKFSPNYERNRDQLRFLEWYLTGKTDIEVNVDTIKPLTDDQHYIAIGDWNTDLKNLKNPGSAVLRNLFAKSRPWMKPEEMTFTNEGSGYSQSPFRLLLDYILVSKSFRPVKGKIIHPDFTKRKELGCGTPAPQPDEKLMKNEGLVFVSYQKKDQDKKMTCYAYVDEFYQTLKKASDHYPLYSELEFRP